MKLFQVLILGAGSLMVMGSSIKDLSKEEKRLLVLSKLDRLLTSWGLDDDAEEKKTQAKREHDEDMVKRKKNKKKKRKYPGDVGAVCINKVIKNDNPIKVIKFTDSFYIDRKFIPVNTTDYPQAIDKRCQLITLSLSTGYTQPKLSVDDFETDELPETFDDVLKDPNESDDHSCWEKRNLISIDKLWTDGVVLYNTTFDTSSDYWKKIENAMAIISDQTCIQFKKNTPENQAAAGHNSYVEIKEDPSKGCRAHVGMLQNGQKLYLYPSACTMTRTILHEFLHTLGLQHEQDRSDRDEYIKVIEENIEENQWYAKKKDTDNYTPYSYKSIMHYRLYYGGKKLLSALDPRLEYLVSLHETDGLEYFDVVDVNKMYNCSANCENQTLCDNGGYMDKTCTCQCPEWLTGDRCQEVDLESDCGGYYFINPGDHVDVSTPNYPSNYSMSATCRWIFKTVPHWYLRMEMIDMRIPFDVNQQLPCDHYLEIRFNLPGETGIKRCGVSSNYSITTSPNTNYENLMMVGFDSTSSSSLGTNRGAKFKVYPVGVHCLVNPCKFGRCKETNQTADGYTCECYDGFMGEDCDEMKSDVQLNCSFEDEKPCFMVNTDEDEADWTQLQGPALGKTPKHAALGNGYFVAEMVEPVQDGNRARLVMVVRNVMERDRCLSFYYHMHGDNDNELSVFVNGENLWKVVGDLGHSWQTAKIILTQSIHEIIIEAKRDGSSISNVAIDELQLSPTNCNSVNRGGVPIRTKTREYVYLSKCPFPGQTKNTIKFQVKGCKSAFVYFMESYKELDTASDNYFQIRIGKSNSADLTTLRKYVGKTVILKKNFRDKTNPVLNCNEYRSFWITWGDGNIKVGRGLNPDNDILLEKAEPDPYNQTFFAISQYSDESLFWIFESGSFQFECGNGQCIDSENRCNDDVDCPNQSDEINCGCSSDNQCRNNGRCLIEGDKCDGEYDCLDNSDEDDVSCPATTTAPNVK